MRLPDWLRYEGGGPMGAGLSRAVTWLGIGLMVLGVLLLLAELGLMVLRPASSAPPGPEVLPLWRAGAGSICAGIVMLLLRASAKDMRGR